MSRLEATGTFTTMLLQRCPMQTPQRALCALSMAASQKTPASLSLDLDVCGHPLEMGLVRSLPLLKTALQN